MRVFLRLPNYLTLIVKAVDSVDASAFVVTAENEEVFRVLDLIGEQETDCLEGLFPPIDVISQEEVIGLRWEAAILKQTKKVIVLPMDIAANLDGRFEFKQDRLVDENFPCFCA